MGNASGKVNASGKANRTHRKRKHIRRSKKYRKGGGSPSPLGKGYTSPHDKMGSAPSNPTATPSSLSGVTPRRKTKRTKKQPPLLPSVLIREALKLYGNPPIKGSVPTPKKKINRNFKVTVTTSSVSKHKSI